MNDNEFFVVIALIVFVAAGTGKSVVTMLCEEILSSIKGENHER